VIGRRRLCLAYFLSISHAFVACDVIAADIKTVYYFVVENVIYREDGRHRNI